MELPTLQLPAQRETGKIVQNAVMQVLFGRWTRTPVMDLQDWNQIAFQTITGAEAAESSDLLTAHARYQNASKLMKQLARKATGPIHGLDGSALNKLSKVLLIEANILHSDTDIERLNLHGEARSQIKRLRKMLKLNKYYLQWRQWAKTNGKKHKRKVEKIIAEMPSDQLSYGKSAQLLLIKSK